MIVAADTCSPRWLDEIRRALSFAVANADRAESSAAGLRIEMERLGNAGLLAACLPAGAGGMGLGLGGSERSTRLACDLLRQAGRASLPVARLFEGHINAVKLVDLYGTPEQAGRVFAQVLEGHLLGVWGADAAEKLTHRRQPNGAHRLEGAKQFASGLGVVSQAVVTVSESGTQGPTRLAIVDVRDENRHDAAAWRATGMRATLSGRFDFTGIETDAGRFLGQPGDYQREPHFEGGVWRYCAAHVGGAEALVDAWRLMLAERGRLDDPLQLARLGRALSLCRAAAAAVEKCCVIVETAIGTGPFRVDLAVAEALLTRQFVEDSCVEILALAEKSLGMQAFVAGSDVERLRRDLSLFIRQAGPDAKLIAATRAYCRAAARGETAW